MGLLAVATTIAVLVAAAPAQATFHLMSIREVYPGSVAQPESSYIELQMYADDQNHVSNQGVTLYNSTGGEIGTFTFGSDLPGTGSNQQTILIGDTGVQPAFGVTPDLESSAFNIQASGGAACWAGSIDCLAWGNFSGSTPSASAVGTPVDESGIPNGMAIRRSISGGNCTNLLDGADDTNDSATDFSNVAPAPQSYATVPAPMSCTPPPSPPSAAIDEKPKAATSETSASFKYHSEPPGASFECRLGAEVFAGCEPSGKSYAGLGQGSHTFQVRAMNGSGTGAPASYTWTIDTTAPTVTIDAQPPNLSPGANSTFKFHANETVSKFECSLAKDAEPPTFSTCSSPKNYSGLVDGSYTFEVRATDSAGNQSTPGLFPKGTYIWTVENSAPDETPPETTIESKPSDPSGSSTASFTYASNESGSSFECMLDGGGFVPCPAGGITYTGLGNGPHTFQVRAIDPSNNVDASPAGYSFEVVLTATPIPPSAGSPPSSAPLETAFAGNPLTKTHDRTPTFRFHSPAAGATFQCKLDRGPYKACRSPFTTKTLSFSRHTLKIRAVLDGTVDPTPSVLRFKVQRP